MLFELNCVDVNSKRMIQAQDRITKFSLHMRLCVCLFICMYIYVCMYVCVCILCTHDLFLTIGLYSVQEAVISWKKNGKSYWVHNSRSNCQRHACPMKMKDAKCQEHWTSVGTNPYW